LRLSHERTREDIGTHGIYSYSYPDDEDFAKDMHEDDWIVANGRWLSDIFAAYGLPFDKVQLRWLYRAVITQGCRC
jgi:hypothetical protein